MSQPIRGRDRYLVFPIGPKNTNFAEDIETLLPVKFHWILLSGFRGEDENVIVNDDGRITDDGQRVITIVHLSLQLRCTKNMSAKFYEDTHNVPVSIVFTMLFPYMSIVSLNLSPQNSKEVNLSPWLTGLPSLMKMHTAVFIMFTRLLYFPVCHLWPWPPKSIKVILSSWLTCVPHLMKVHTIDQSLVFRRLFPYISIVTLSFDLKH